MTITEPTTEECPRWCLSYGSEYGCLSGQDGHSSAGRAINLSLEPEGLNSVGGRTRTTVRINVRQLAPHDPVIVLTAEEPYGPRVRRRLTLTEAALLAADLLAAMLQVETPRNLNSEDCGRPQHSADLVAVRREQLASFVPPDGTIGTRLGRTFYCATCASWIEVEKGTTTSARKAHRAQHAKTESLAEISA